MAICLSDINRASLSSVSYVRSFNFHSNVNLAFGQGTVINVVIPGTHILDTNTKFLVGQVNAYNGNPYGPCEFGATLNLNSSGGTLKLAEQYISRYSGYAEDFNVMGQLDLRAGIPTVLQSPFTVSVSFYNYYPNTIFLYYYSVTLFELSSI